MAADPLPGQNYRVAEHSASVGRIAFSGSVRTTGTRSDPDNNCTHDHGSLLEGDAIAMVYKAIESRISCGRRCREG